MNLWPRTTLALIALGLSCFFFLPNVLPQKLVIAFHKNLPSPKSEKKPVSSKDITAFLQDSKKGLAYFFPGKQCRAQEGDGLPEEYRCIIEDSFVTAAQLNELVQARPDLINPYLSRILPHPIEAFLGSLRDKASKNLKIKLGLDLQGGMRAVFRADFQSYLERMKEKLLPQIAKLQAELKTEKDPQKQSEKENEIASLEARLVLEEGQKLELLQNAKDVIDKRLASQNLTEPEVRVQESSYSVAVDMPGVANSKEVLARIKDTVTVEYRIVNDDATRRVAGIAQNREDLQAMRKIYRRKIFNPEEVQILLDSIIKRSKLTSKEGRLFLHWRRARNKVNSPLLPREFRVLGPPLLDGSEMESAWSGRDPNGAWFQIYFRLTGEGAKKFGDLTKENVGKRMAILWGDRVMSDPVLREAIYGGSGVISGQFSERESREISNVIQEGALPIPMELLSVSSVGPTLGRSSIEAGLISIMIGYGAVLFFMILYYHLCGCIAVIALFCNLLIMMGIMSLLEFTFTLPGIAGIILTVGMAVDASVIIFEKIKEGLRENKSPMLAIETGFHASTWTIVDANVTTLIAAIILWMPRDGPIMGFAIVIFFGLLTSMFTALYLSRLLFDWAARFLPMRRLSIGFGVKAKAKL